MFEGRKNNSQQTKFAVLEERILIIFPSTNRSMEGGRGRLLSAFLSL